jgi:hypothetical protein
VHLIPFQHGSSKSPGSCILAMSNRPTIVWQGFILCGTVSYGTVPKNYLVSVCFLTQAMMKSDTTVPKKLIFSPIKGRLPLTPPPCWAHVNAHFN